MGVLASCGPLYAQIARNGGRPLSTPTPVSTPAIATPTPSPAAAATPVPTPVATATATARPAPPPHTSPPAPPAFTYHSFPNGSSDPDFVVTGPDGNLWMIEPNANAIARATTSGVIAEFRLAGGRSPMGLVVGSDGNLWFTEIGTGDVARITPAGVITEFPVPRRATGAIAAGPDGALWFGEGGGIGRITVQGSVTDFPTTDVPHSMVQGPDGALWFTEALYTAGQPAPHEGVGRITTAGAVTDFDLPHPPMFAGDIVAGGGALWIGEQGMLVRMTTQGVATEIPLSGGQQLTPTSMTYGPDGRIWMPGSSDSPRIIGIGTTGAVTVHPVTGMGAGGAYVYNVGVGPDRHIWALGGFGVQAPSGVPAELIRMN